MTKTTQRRSTVKKLPLDGVLLTAVAALLALGVVMVASASLHLGERFDNPFHYLERHLLAVALGIVGGVVATRIPTRWWAQSSTLLYFVGLLLLLVVLLPGIGKTVNGATRWVAFGPFNLQTSEFMKFFLVLYLAGYLARRQLEVTHSTWAFVKPVLLLVLAASLTMWQPDFGTSAVLLATALGMMFLGGAPLWQFAVLLTAAISALAALVYVSPYRMERVTSFLNPWADERGAGYQLVQALIAFGRGEWTGVGLGSGVQKLFYLPEAHTDFLLAVIGEEFGLIGTLLVIALFVLVVWRAFAIGVGAQARSDRFSTYVAYGLGLWLGLQAFINIGVNIGLLPTKGLTLPFMSYGSNSLIVSVVAIGVLLRIQYENVTTANGGSGRKVGDAAWLRA